MLLNYRPVLYVQVMPMATFNSSTAFRSSVSLWPEVVFFTKTCVQKVLENEMIRNYQGSLNGSPIWGVSNFMTSCMVNLRYLTPQKYREWSLGPCVIFHDPLFVGDHFSGSDAFWEKRSLKLSYFQGEAVVMESTNHSRYSRFFKVTLFGPISDLFGAENGNEEVTLKKLVVKPHANSPVFEYNEGKWFCKKTFW